MAVSDDYRVEMWREVLSLSRVNAGENVIVVTGEPSHPQNIDAAMRSVVSMGARVFRVDLPPIADRSLAGLDRTAYLGVTPLTGQAIATAALKQADMVIDLLGLLHSPEQLEVLAAGTRMLMVVEPPDILARLVPTAGDKQRVMAADACLRAGRTMRVTSKAGTDLTLSIGQFPTLPEYGFADEPGHWDHWPSGFTSTWPNEGSGEGQVVVDAGDMLFPFKMYVTTPVKLMIRKGMITDIDGGFEARYLRDHIQSFRDSRAFAISHVGWGLQAKARWTALGMRDKAQSLGMDARSFYGNFLFSTGPNAEAGGTNTTPCHVDIPMGRCSISIDGRPMTIDGDVVAPDQRVVQAQ
jgi:2,5-dihydroxypyridine 5,6-dioxygenase